MNALPDPAYTEFEKGERQALLQVRSFMARFGPKEVDAFCAQRLHDLSMDRLHWDAAERAKVEISISKKSK